MNSKIISIAHVNSRQPTIHVDVPLLQELSVTETTIFLNFIYTKIILTTLQLTRLRKEKEIKGTKQVDLKTVAVEACLV